MCGIVGYIGTREAQNILLDCLGRLEYRGYDSCGIAVCGDHLRSHKDSGRVRALRVNAPVFNGSVGIGHTRWSTHGLPSAINAHPHLDCSGKIAVVHNGIITNYLSLRQKLAKEGHVFVSDTDTEIIPHLIEKFYKGDLADAVNRSVSELEGSFAIAVIAEGQQQIVVARKDNPLIIGLGDGETFIASDVPAILDYTNRIIYLENGDIAVVEKNRLGITQNDRIVYRPVELFTGNAAEIKKGGYEHFMLKEIYEQPGIVKEAINNNQAPGDGPKAALTLDSLFQDLLIVGCGTSYHAGLVGKYLFEKFAGIPVRVEIGSEFSRSDYLVLPSNAITITQSGETADLLVSLKKLKAAGVNTTVITNTRGSSASRLGNKIIYTNAGPELSVAATKSFMAQIIELYKMALTSSPVNGTIAKALREQFHRLPTRMEELLEHQEHIADICEELRDCEAVFYIGRGINYPIALEGALKLKEIAYVYAEGYAAGELKHGPFALLDDSTPVVAIVPKDNYYDQMLGSLEEIKARRSPIIALVDEEDEIVEDLADRVIKIPHVHNLFSPVLNTIAVQLIAYHTAKPRGCPIDFPRNLAKSVTVE